jgi:hypothetical protein
VRNLTPSHMRCVYAAACPSVHELDDGRLLIVGEYVSTNEVRQMGANPDPETEGGVIIDRALLANVHAEAIASLQGEVERLREALEPFATTADQLDRHVDGARSQQAQFFKPFLNDDDGDQPLKDYPIPDDATLLYAMRWHDPHPVSEVIGLQMKHLRDARAALSQHPGEGEKA